MSTTLQTGRESSSQKQPWPANFLSKITLERLLLSLSIATLCFATTWREIVGLVANPSARYFEAEAPDTKLLLALITDVLILTAIIFSGFVLRQKSVRSVRFLGTFFIGFFSLVALYEVQRSVNGVLEHLLRGHLSRTLDLGIPALAIVLLARFPKPTLRAARVFFLVLSPLFPILALNGFVLYRTNDVRAARKGEAAGMLPIHKDHKDRVIWIIFDELDQRMLFDARPSRIQATEFDRLRAESIYADHVRTPAFETLLSIPSLLTGDVITDTKLNTSKLLFKTKDCSKWTDFNSQPNVLSRARAAGFNTALAGWQHPYARVMGNSLSDCSWDICATYVYSVARFLHSQPFYYNVLYIAQWQAYQMPVLYTFGWASAAREQQRVLGDAHISVVRFVGENGLRMLRNRDLDLVFLHFPLPHPPGVWDIKAQKFTDGDSTYVDNLQPADKFLGKVRRTLEETGDWDRSTILVSSDHPYREYYWGPPEKAPDSPHNTQPYVPFLLKLPGQHEGVAYHREFNNVISGDLLLEALEGKVRTVSQALEWLDSRAAGSSEINRLSCQ